MSVLPYRTELFEKCKEVYQFLSACQRQAIVAQHAKLANVSFVLPAIAPWQVLDRFVQPRQVYFYYDNALAQQSIVALGVAVAQQASGRSRFERMQQFIDVWRKRIICASEWAGGHGGLGLESAIPFSKPHFFSGFTFFDTVESDKSPFDAAQVFVPQMQISTGVSQSTVSFNVLVDDADNVARLADEIGQQLRDVFAFVDAPATDFMTLPQVMGTPIQRNRKITKDVYQYRQMVARALKLLPQKNLRKVVLAEAMEVLSALPFKSSASLHMLRIMHPDCYMFSLGNGRGQEFLGASPERLLSIHQHHLITDALAGSAPRGQTREEDALLAQTLLSSQKELYEHRVVVDFIVQQLRELGLTPRLASKPDILRLGNIQHLHTPISADLPTHLEPLTVLAQLHPTPAVAGLPREAACDLIDQAESFPRDLYAAPLGWVDADGNSEFIVGIRSALIDGRQATLYAGAGIVPGSDPDKELNEIRLKLQALLGALV
jgi:menaquinone-specific isochorismate synthase